MDLEELIYRRKSCRSYTGKPVDSNTLARIRSCMEDLKPLYPQIRVRSEILRRDQVKCLCPWTTPQVIAIYSRREEGFLENVGFVYQQLDLYLQSIGLGVCWLGMGRLDSSAPKGEDGLEYVIMLAFGEPHGSALRSGKRDFKRKSHEQIADREDERLEPARLAPSSVNSQPWYFTHDGDAIHAYCSCQGLLKNKGLGDMNRIDMGIALAHMYVANADSFRFFRVEEVPQVKGCEYIGSFRI